MGAHWHKATHFELSPSTSAHAQNPAKRIWYESEIHVDDRTGNPWFTVRALDGSGLAFDGANPTQAWHKARGWALSRHAGVGRGLVS